jgi:hypothetical protein
MEADETVSEGKKSKTSSVINRAYARKFMLEHAKDNRYHPFKRVSEQTLNDLEEATKRWIRNHVDKAPSRGVTL